MKRIYWILLLCLVLSNCSSSGKELPMPPEKAAVSYSSMNPEVWKLDNGLTVVFLEDAELPLVRGSLMIPGGSLQEFNGKPVLVPVMGQQMRQGGAGNLNADNLDLELEKLSAGVSSSYGAEFGTISFLSLSTDFEKVFSIFSDVVQDPLFSQDRIDLWKGQMIESIRRRADDPESVASLALKAKLFGNTPFGRIPTEAEVKDLTRIDLLKAHRYYVKPDGAYLAITGKIDRAKLKAEIQSKFAGWTPRGKVLKEFPTFNFKPTPAVYFIKQPLTQATVYMAEPGPVRLSPDYAAIDVFNNIFGGGDFGSRLVKKIRTDLGLAYSVYGATMPGFQVGQNIMVLQTKSESTGLAIAESIKIIEEFKVEDLQKGELEQAKKSINNSFVFKFDSVDEALQRFVLLRLLSYPLDYDKTYLNMINGLAAQDIKNVAIKHWKPSEFVIAVVGNEAALESIKKIQLEKPELFKGLPLRICEFDTELRSCN